MECLRRRREDFLPPRRAWVRGHHRRQEVSPLLHLEWVALRRPHLSEARRRRRAIEVRRLVMEDHQGQEGQEGREGREGQEDHLLSTGPQGKGHRHLGSQEVQAGQGSPLLLQVWVAHLRRQGATFHRLLKEEAALPQVVHLHRG